MASSKSAVIFKPAVSPAQGGPLGGGLNGGATATLLDWRRLSCSQFASGWSKGGIDAGEISCGTGDGGDDIGAGGSDTTTADKGEAAMLAEMAADISRAAVDEVRSHSTACLASCLTDIAVEVKDVVAASSARYPLACRSLNDEKNATSWRRNSRRPRGARLL